MEPHHLHQACAHQIENDILDLARAYPFHAAMLERWIFKTSELTPTLGISLGQDNRIHLNVNPAFYLEQGPDVRGGLLRHELHHVLLGHLGLDPRQYTVPQAMVAAIECSANEFIPVDLPGALRIEQWNLPPLESTVKRYARLEEIFKTNNQDSTCPDLPWPQPLDDHSLMQAQTAPDNESVENVLREEIARALNTLTKSEKEGIDPLTQARIRPWLASPSGSGSAGATGVEAIGIIRQPNPLPWPRILARLCPTITCESVLTYPNRRLPHLVGIVPGWRTRSSRPHVMAVIDTSGSVSVDALQRIVAELKAMQRWVQRITVVECDDQIRQVYLFMGKIEVLSGRGGTDFSPPLEMDFLQTISPYPNAIVYFTDGQGEAPPVQPPIPLLWCLTKGGRVPATYGSVEWME